MFSPGFHPSHIFSLTFWIWRRDPYCTYVRKSYSDNWPKPPTSGMATVKELEDVLSGKVISGTSGSFHLNPH